LELRQLKEFLTVLESGSLGEAARKLGVAQSNLTKSIQALERSVGGALFLRTKRGMNPTALGHALETRARVILGEVGRTHRELGELVEGQAGKIVIASGISFAQAILPRALSRFRERHPQIEVFVIEEPWPEVLPGVRTSDIDYAIYPTSALRQRDLASEVLLPDQEVVIATNARNPLAAKPRVTLKEISAGPWLLPAEPDILRKDYDSIFTTAGLAPLRPTIEFTSYSFARRVIQTDNFLGFFSRLLIQDEIDRKVIAVVRVPAFKRKITFHAIYRSDAAIPLAAQKLLAEIRKSCKEYRAGADANDR
jgi:DNA-binding transcriptional LysR family regulator